MQEPWSAQTEQKVKVYLHDRNTSQKWVGKKLNGGFPAAEFHWQSPTSERGFQAAASTDVLARVGNKSWNQK